MFDFQALVKCNIKQLRDACVYPLYDFPGAVIANDDRRGGRGQQKCAVSLPRRPKVQDRRAGSAVLSPEALGHVDLKNKSQLCPNKNGFIQEQ